MPNPITAFFNGRPANAKKPSGIRITLRPAQMVDLIAGQTVYFHASGIRIEIVPAKK